MKLIRLYVLMVIDTYNQVGLIRQVVIMEQQGLIEYTHPKMVTLDIIVHLILLVY